MSRIYLTPLPNATADRSQESVSSAIQQSGLIDKDGTAVENVATESVDLSLTGRYQFGEQLNRKFGAELNSMAESTITALPFVDPPGTTTASLERRAGYYELERAEVTPAHPVTERLFEYDVGLTYVGSRESHVRSVATVNEDVTTPLATGSPGTITIPAQATRPRWYTQAGGTVAATPTSTQTAEFGDVDVFSPFASPYTDPTLLYDLPFDLEGKTDVRVYDDRNAAKYATTPGGQQVSQWIHAYHSAYEFEGQPVIDTGRIRLSLDVASGALTATGYTPASDIWDPLNVTMGNYALTEFSFDRIGPAGVTVTLTLTDTTTGSEEPVVVNARRGKDTVLVRPVVGGTVTQSVADVFATIGSTQTTDPNPAQDLMARDDI